MTSYKTKWIAHQQHINWIFSGSICWIPFKILSVLWTVCKKKKRKRYTDNLIALEWSGLIFVENPPHLHKICFNWKNVLGVIRRIISCFALHTMYPWVYHHYGAFVLNKKCVINEYTNVVVQCTINTVHTVCSVQLTNIQMSRYNREISYDVITPKQNNRYTHL